MSKITITKLNSLPQQVEENRKNINTLGSEIDTANTNIASLTTRTASVESKFPISASDISDSAVTSAKIATSAVTTDKIASGAITKDKIASGVLPSGCSNIFIATCDVSCSDGAIRNFGVYLKTEESTMGDHETDRNSFLETLYIVLKENNFTSEGGLGLTIFGYDASEIYANSDTEDSVYYSHKTTSGYTIETLSASNIINCSYIIIPC